MKQAELTRHVRAALKAAADMKLPVTGYRVTFHNGSPCVEVTIAPPAALPPPHVAQRIAARMRMRLRGAHDWLDEQIRWEEVVGYTLDTLCRHLAQRFRDGMSWENVDDWHIDHIRPLASFSAATTDCQDFRDAWALSNLQPLWARDNLSKGARWQ